LTTNLKIIELNDLTKNIVNLLDKEFDFLKSQNIDNFLSIQDQKEKLLADLSQRIIDFDISSSLIKNQPQFDDFFANIQECQKSQKRNSILVSRKIDAIRGALNSLESKNNNSTELYNKLGKINNSKLFNYKGFEEI
jgi:flagellar biosynthesis/type III secretory pathway chaperone